MLLFLHHQVSCQKLYTFIKKSTRQVPSPSLGLYKPLRHSFLLITGAPNKALCSCDLSLDMRELSFDLVTAHLGIASRSLDRRSASARDMTEVIGYLFQDPPC